MGFWEKLGTGMDDAAGHVSNLGGSLGSFTNVLSGFKLPSVNVGLDKKTIAVVFGVVALIVGAIVFGKKRRRK